MLCESLALRQKFLTPIVAGMFVRLCVEILVHLLSFSDGANSQTQSIQEQMLGEIEEEERGMWISDGI